MRWPLKEICITQFFGARPEVYKQFGLAGHNGLDFRAKIGTPVYASIDGKIKNIKSKTGYGNHIKQQNKDFQVCYGHLDSFACPNGSYMRAGELVGHSGNSGFSSGPHVHFGVRRLGLFGKVKNYNNGYKGWINPCIFLNAIEKEMNLIEKILKLFKSKHLQDSTALIFTPDRNGEVYLLKGNKKIKVKGTDKLVEALLALHAIGISNKDADLIPDGGNL